MDCFYIYGKHELVGILNALNGTGRTQKKLDRLEMLE